MSPIALTPTGAIAPDMPRIVRVGSRTNEPARWRPDIRAIAAACDHLGIERDVVVNEVRYERGRWAGMHNFRAGTHHISIARWCTPDAASRIMWHELRHAEQSERLGHDAFMADYMSYGRKGPGYATNPYELEARDTETMHDFHPLAGPA